MPANQFSAHVDSSVVNPTDPSAPDSSFFTLFFREGLSTYSGGFVGGILAGLLGSGLGIIPAIGLALLGFILGRLVGVWLDLRHHTLTR